MGILLPQWSAQKVEQYDNGNHQLFEIKFYDSNGEEHGESKVFSQDGKLLSTESYNHGKPHGIFFKYYFSGIIRTECKFIDNLIVGEYKGYFKNGNIKYLLFYEKGNQIWGKFYNEDGS